MEKVIWCSRASHAKLAFCPIKSCLIYFCHKNKRKEVLHENSRHHCQTCVHEQQLWEHHAVTAVILLRNLCPFNVKTKVNPAAASTCHLMNIFFCMDYKSLFSAARSVTLFIQGCNLPAALLPDEWTVRSHAQLAHQQSRSLRATHHWLRTRACHREERRSSKQLLNGVVNYLSRPDSLCDHSVYRSADWSAFFPLSPVWSSPRCWNMNQSAGAAQHSRRYSSDKVRRGSGCRWPLPVWSCLHDSFGLNFQETLVYRENKVDCCEEPKPKHVEEVVSHLTDI